MATEKFTLPTEFTPQQLEELRMLAHVEAQKRPDDPEIYNLGRKLDEYCRQARRVCVAV